MMARCSLSCSRGKLIQRSSAFITNPAHKLRRYDDQEALDKHMAIPPVGVMMEALGKGDLADVQVIRTTAGSGIKARI